MSNRTPGIKVPMSEHKMVRSDAHIAGWSFTCSCGFTKTGLFPAYVGKRAAENERAQVHANHVRHMALVHDVQTHGNEQCGHACIYPRVKADA